jgi:hypothetical protein
MCAQVNEAFLPALPGSYLYESLVLSFPSEIAPRDRLVLVLHGYFDESGTHGGSRAISVAGYLSTADRWLTFEQEWKAALNAYGLESFHMTDFVARKEEFASWEDAERSERLANLIAIINRNVVASVAFALPMRDYYSIFSKTAKHYTGGAYGLAAVSCFMDASSAVQTEHPNAKIAYVFERGVKGRGQVMKVFDHACDSPELRASHRLLSLKYEDKRDFVALQAADILAYELYRHLPIQLNELPEMPRMNVLRALQKCPINYWKTFGGETMRNFAIVIDMAAQIYGVRGPKTKRRWN